MHECEDLTLLRCQHYPKQSTNSVGISIEIPTALFVEVENPVL